MKAWMAAGIGLMLMGGCAGGLQQVWQQVQETPKLPAALVALRDNCGDPLLQPLMADQVELAFKEAGVADAAARADAAEVLLCGGPVQAAG